jgi:rubrerythrin
MEETTMDMQTEGVVRKPEYLGLLNAISLGESEAGVYLEAWANATDNEDLACTLRLVAAREASHGEVFCRRISELGFQLRPKADPKAAAKLAKYANPKISDLEKIGPERDDSETNAFFADTERKIAEGYFDHMTCNLMQWYINEEKDSARRLRECYAAVRAKAGSAKGKANSHGKATNGGAAAASSDAEAIIACMTAGFQSLEKSIERLAKAVR